MMSNYTRMLRSILPQFANLVRNNQQYRTKTLSLLLVLLVLVLLDSENATSQSGSVQTATMKDGRVVILKTDGTWEYAKETRKEGISNQTAEKATLLEVQTDQVAYVERPVVITGTLEMFSYYFGGYRNSQDTHYAFLLRDPSRGASPADVYIRRADAAANLRK